VEQLCRGILERGIDIRWACCCKLEATFSPALFELMRSAGCFEIFWGLESASARVLRLMDKEVPGLSLAGIRRLLREANDAGIGLHVSLIAGFRGDTPKESIRSVEFVVETLRDASNATFNVNRFMLLDGSPVMADPGRFGIIQLPVTGDMPFRHPYRLTPGLAGASAGVDRLLPGLRRRLVESLGWDRFGRGPAAELATDLHFFFGQGSIIKQTAGHAFGNPLTWGASAA
jgi:hypothetical protein